MVRSTVDYFVHNAIHPYLEIISIKETLFWSKIALLFYRFINWYHYYSAYQLCASASFRPTLHDTDTFVHSRTYWSSTGSTIAHWSLLDLEWCQQEVRSRPQRQLHICASSCIVCRVRVTYVPSLDHSIQTSGHVYKQHWNSRP